MMRVSVIIAVKNEERHIRDLFESLLAQTKQPDEIVIVDGGSHDNTVTIIKEYSHRGMPINIIEADDALPGRGRNIAIAAARNDIIAMTDGGIILDKRWLEYLIAPFENDSAVDVVYGTYTYCARTLFEQCFCVVFISPGKQYQGKEIHYPSLASFALNKHIWAKAGKFREDLRATEDMLFFRQIEQLNCKSFVQPNAVAYWRPRPSLKETLLSAFAYAKCDAINLFHIQRYIRKYIVYGIGLLFIGLGIYNRVWLVFLILGIIVNTLLVSLKNRNEFFALMRTKPVSLFVITAIILTIDISRLAGFSIEFVKKKFMLKKQ